MAGGDSNSTESPLNSPWTQAARDLRRLSLLNRRPELEGYATMVAWNGPPRTRTTNMTSLSQGWS
jgi:hypothetical protein